MDVVLGSWRLVGRGFWLSGYADEGLTTVARPRGGTRLVYRGDSSIPRAIKAQGWPHIGDPDSRDGYLFDCYQGAAGARSKMFRVTTPTGETFEYDHPLQGDEKMNNSYVAISPDGQWMLSGEWEVTQRILVFPTPILNPATPRQGGSLPLVGMLKLDRQVRNVQGATFVSPTRLLCSTDDPDTALWPTPRQLLQVDLAAPLDGESAEGTVTSLGPVPLKSLCRGTFEVEGIDYDATTGDLRVAVNPPSLCGSLVTAIYRFRQEG